MFAVYAFCRIVDDIVARARPAGGGRFRYAACSRLEEEVLKSYADLHWNDAHHEYAWYAWLRFVAPYRLLASALVFALVTVAFV